jgi:hypothetical protein
VRRGADDVLEVANQADRMALPYRPDRSDPAVPEATFLEESVVEAGRPLHQTLE